MHFTLLCILHAFTGTHGLACAKQTAWACAHAYDLLVDIRIRQLHFVLCCTSQHEDGPQILGPLQRAAFVGEWARG